MDTYVKNGFALFRTIKDECSSFLISIFGFGNFLRKGSLNAKQYSNVSNVVRSTTRFATFMRKILLINKIKNLAAQKHLWVLVVDDDALTLRIHKNMFLDLNCCVDVASNGSEALAMANNKYDLILLDIDLPDINGIEVATKILQKYNKQKRQKIVAVTSYATEKVRNQCLEVGIKEVIIKPVTIKTLERLIFPCIVH